MADVTAVELGPDTCVLVRVAMRGADVRVIGVEILNPAAFPGNDPFIASLDQLRRKMKLPRRARVVLWGLPDGGTPRDPAVQPLLAPLQAAGFRVQRVVSPCNALAALARIRTPRPDGAMGWLAVDRAGVAIVIARPGEVLYSHAFNWDSSIGATGSQARMLQRYSLVAFLAPELRRAIAAAREKNARVDSIITCGNLPDLRSLTMPLIEELDLEVETLDSLDGLAFAPEMHDRLTELAPAIRMACAGAATRPARPPAVAPTAAPRPAAAAAQGRNVTGWLLSGAGAALLVAVGGIGWFWYSQRLHRHSQAAVAASMKTPGSSASPGPRPSAPSAPRRPEQLAQRPPAAPQPPAARTKPQNAAPAAPPVLQRVTGVRPQSPKVIRGSSRPLHPPAPLLDDPLPQISTILVSPERRFAMVNGRAVTVGDHVGQRVVTAIEPRTVVFREPSGVQILVGMRGRLVGVKGR
jgi:hypothetical protein